MSSEKLHFITHQFVPLVSTLSAPTTPKWGKMNVQQMVEHVAAFFNVSSGKLYFELVTPEEHLPKFKEFLLSDKHFRENTKAPLTVLGEEPLPLCNATLEEAVKKLQISIDEFVAYFATGKEQVTIHPVFGPLNFEEWVLLHYKHVTHHARQFGLL